MDTKEIDQDILKDEKVRHKISKVSDLPAGLDLLILHYFKRIFPALRIASTINCYVKNNPS
jgi:hypothetical protein